MQLGEGWTFAHRPALDGLRGVAVLLVIAGHCMVPLLAWGGGAVGVAVFFTLSGFLITSLLLRDVDRQGRVAFGRFYIRRARRLLPALFSVVAVVLVTGLFLDDFVHWQLVVGALFYSANWMMIDGSTFPGDALNHTWSLSIEEQFYLLWPVTFLILIRRGRVVLLGLIAILSVGAVAERVMLWTPGQYDDWRIYFGLDTRIDGLLIGGGLAVLMQTVVTEKARPICVAVGLLGIGGAALSFRGAALIVVGPAWVAVCAALVIFGAAQITSSWVLTARPIRWVGARSYGLYLWHVPIVVVLRDHLGVEGWWLLLPTTLVVSVAVAALSWRFVEGPFLATGIGAARGRRDTGSETRPRNRTVDPA